MAGTIMTSFGAGDANATAYMALLNKVVIGQSAIAGLIDYSPPTIPAGSWIEVNGAIVSFDADEIISTIDPITSTTVADGIVRIVIVPSGSSATAHFTATAPAVSYSRQGYYGVPGTALENCRYLQMYTIKSGSTYSGDYYYTDQMYEMPLIERVSSDMTSVRKISANGEISAPSMYTSGGIKTTPTTGGFYKSEKKITLSSTSTYYAYGEHYISNAGTNNRIRNISVFNTNKGISDGFRLYLSGSSFSALIGFIAYKYDDTNITAYPYDLTGTAVTWASTGYGTDVVATIVYE